MAFEAIQRKLVSPYGKFYRSGTPDGREGTTARPAKQEGNPDPKKTDRYWINASPPALVIASHPEGSISRWLSQLLLWHIPLDLFVYKSGLLLSNLNSSKTCGSLAVCKAYTDSSYRS
jgi:hypothetical protein